MKLQRRQLSMILRTFMNALIKVVSFVVNFFNGAARNIKQLLLALFKPEKKFKASYIRESLNEIKALTVKDDWLNIQNDYRRIGKDLHKALNAYEG